VSASLESAALLYRLGYADPYQLEPYAFARWSAPPGQLLRQRLREHLARTRPVLDSAAGASLARRGGSVPPVLRVELEEFSQLFETQTESKGVLRLRCTLLESTAAGERLVAQRSFTVQRPAPSADAAGGVRALTAATDAVAADIAAWLLQPR
jgi:cholesterol transport system auxiliary component